MGVKQLCVSYKVPIFSLKEKIAKKKSMILVMLINNDQFSE